MNILINYIPGHAGPKIMKGFAKAFRRLGHTVTDKPAGEAMLESYDFIMGYSGASVLNTKKIGEKIFTLAHFFNARVAQYWADDMQYDISRGRKIAPAPVGLILQSDRGCSEKWKAAGIDNIYMPLATDEEIFRPLDVEKTYDVVLTGNASPPEHSARAKMSGHHGPCKRANILQRLADLNVAVFGPWKYGWEYYPEFSDFYKGCLDTNEELNLVYNQSRICIDMSAAQNLNSANFTVFNAMASGCVLITNDKPALDSLFGSAKPPVYRDDCREVVMRYLDDPDLARAEAMRQRKTILSGHTFVHRAKAVLEEAGKTERYAFPPEMAAEIKRVNPWMKTDRPDPFLKL